jgi:hypothetical protein
MGKAETERPTMTSSVVCGVVHSPHARAVARFAALLSERLVTEAVERADAPDVVGPVEQGLAPECLCRVAEEESGAFIVVGTNGDAAARAAVVGSVSLARGIGDRDDAQPVRVAARLARALELQRQPVPVVRSQDDERSGTTAAGIRSPSTEGASACAQAALEAAMAVVGTSATPVVVCCERK